MLEQLRKLFKQSAHAKSDGNALPAIDLSQLQTSAESDADADELDALYRQALAAMDAVESGCESLADELPETPSAEVGRTGLQARPKQANDGPGDPSCGVTPGQILEAALFVGGTDLTLKTLCKLLGNEFSSDRVDEFIQELNQRYSQEGRPYDIRFGEGGYRLALRPELDDVRNRVFGLGPKDVKLSQEALEVLSLIAYRQPIAADDVAELRGGPPGGVLRQLLRRELIGLVRSEEDPKQVRYHTTPRFLEAFGLATLDDLPQADDLAYK